MNTYSVTLYHYNGNDWDRLVAAQSLVFSKVEGNENKGLTVSRSVIMRLFTTDTISLMPNDRAVIGICEDIAPPKDEALTVVSVTDNRQGSINMQHWKVVCV